MASDYGKFTPISVRSETTMTNDTKAPERIGVKMSEGYEVNTWSVLTHRFDEDGVEYVCADLALAAQGALIERAAREAYETADVQIGEERYDLGWKESALTTAQDIRRLSPDATAALEAVRREAVEQERGAVVQWLLDVAGQDMCPPNVAKLLRHEAKGIEHGLHVQDQALTTLAREGQRWDAGDTPPQET